MSRFFLSPLLLAVSTLLVMLAGCSSSADRAAQEKQQKAMEGPSAAEIIQQMRKVYRQAKTFTCNAETVQQFVLRSDRIVREVPLDTLALAFKRPNRLRYSFETSSLSSDYVRYDLVSNGTIVRAAAAEVPEQIFETTAPLTLTIENHIPEPQLRQDIYEQLREDQEQLPLRLLLAESNSDDADKSGADKANAAESFYPGDGPPHRLGKSELGESECYRIAYDSDAGQRILWIDTKTHLLRRMDLPTAVANKQMGPAAEIARFAIWVNYKECEIDQPIAPSAFEMEVPEQARRVRKFVEPPPPAPPEFLGKPPGEFTYETLDGKQMTLEDFKGKPTLLDFWHTHCPPCQAQTPVMEELAKQLGELGKADGAGVAFYAVSSDPETLSGQQIKKTLANWGGTFPILRDPEGLSYEAFHIRVTPTAVLLDAEGNIQYFHIGLNESPDLLLAAAKQVLAGENLARQIRADYQAKLAAFEQQLEEATIGGSLLEVEVGRAETAERALPVQFTVSDLWSAKPETLQRPGNIAFVQDGQDLPYLFVLDGGAAVVAYDLSGAEVARHELAENVEQAGGFLRTAVDAEGRRWTAVSGVGWQKVHLFDEAWEPKLTFPKSRHPGIADVALVDLGEASGLTLCVGYWGGVGVQGVSLDGKRLWSDRTLDQVVQILAAPPEQGRRAKLWCMSDRGSILPLDAEGKRGPPIYVADQPLMHVAVSDFADGESADGESAAETKLCGLAVSEIGKYRAVGFTADGKVQWTYDLPPGEYAQQVTRIQAVSLPGDQPAWMIAAADGSIHWLSPTGELIDSFAYGKELTGVAMTNAEKFAILVVSTSDEMTAWKVE